MKPISFVRLLQAFFNDWMGQQRNLSHHTVLSYRDTWRLFLRFVSGQKKRPIAQLQLADLDGDSILAFLKHCEHERECSIGTRNCRLAALRSFFRYVAQEEPSAAAQCAEILRIPTKRGEKRPPRSLDEDEVNTILRQPDRAKPEGQRDHALMALLYNTGLRIQEALNVRPRDIRFQAPAHVRVMGKGRKERTCPIWPETVALLRALLKRSPRSDDEPLFVNRYGDPLGAAGVRFKLAQYVSAAAKTIPALKNKKKITPHSWRHTVGVHLTALGVDVVAIRDLLGHANLETTNIYARSDVETQRKALGRVDRKSRPAKPAPWKHAPELLAWLDRL
jgi:site-specific recombinase XerD